MAASEGNHGDGIGVALSLDAALRDLVGRQLVTMRLELVGARTRVPLPELVDLAAQLRATPSLTSEQRRLAERAVKDMARTVIQCVRAVAMDADNVSGFVHLDENVLPLMQVMALVVDKHKQKGKPEPDSVPWIPFVLYASAFFACGYLPASDAMQCTAVAEQTIAASQTLLGQSTQAQVFASTIDRIVSLTSQDVSKDEWVAESSISKHVLQWIVLQVPFPHLGGDVLGRVLALVFPLVDDLTDATQLVGATMLRHIVHNVTPTELRWYADVLLEVLRSAITSRKPATLDALLDALVESLDKLSPPHDFALYERFVPRLLTDCSLSSEVALRVLYTRHLRRVVARLGAPHSIFLIRYLQPLLKVLVASFESIHTTLVLETLETLRAVVLAAWPRVPAHTERIFVGVVKAVALCEAFGNDDGVGTLPAEHDKQAILTISEDILVLLHELNRESGAVQRLLRQVQAESRALHPFSTRMLAKLT